MDSTDVRVVEELEVAARARARWPTDPSPYAGRVRVVFEGRVVDALLAAGPAPTSGEGGLVRATFHESPYAPLLLGAEEGDEVVVGGARGVLARRSIVTFEGGEVVEVRVGGEVFRSRHGTFARDHREHVLPPRPIAARERVHSLVDVDLDPKQRAAVELPRGRSLLVLGEAGHGKTTVALHRVAHLARAAGPRFRAVVIVPTEGLRELLARELVKLGTDVPVTTYDAWARKQARKAFGDLPKRESTGATPAVVKLKRDPALVEELARRAHEPPGRIDDDEDAPEPATNAHATRSDLQHLFGDSAVLERVVARSARRHAKHAIGEALEHTHVQFSPRAAEEFADVTDRKRLRAIDARSIDEGTPNADAGTVDVEDYAVLFELDRLRAAVNGVKSTKPRAFDCIVIDEAQELAELELRLLGRSLAKNGTLVVAGDADQQLDESTELVSWDRSMELLGAKEHARVVLEIGYRCAPDVVRLAERALGRSSEPAVVHHEPTELHLAEWLARELDAIQRDDSRATIAVIARTALAARRLAALLRGATPARLVLDGRFTHGAAQITSVDQVRGLEFDFVVVPDATGAAYPDTPTSRRALYVAITRARHRVAVASVGDPSPIL